MLHKQHFLNYKERILMISFLCHCLASHAISPSVPDVINVSSLLFQPCSQSLLLLQIWAQHAEISCSHISGSGAGVMIRVMDATSVSHQQIDTRTDRIFEVHLNYAK